MTISRCRSACSACRSNGRERCPGTGTPIRRTTSVSWRPSSAAAGSAPAAPTTSPRPGRTLATRRRAARSSSCATTRAAAGVPQRVPPPRLAAGRRVRPGARAVVPVPRLGVPARRVAGQGRWRRASRTASTRPTTRSARCRSTTFARSIMVNVDPARRAVRPRAARRRARRRTGSTSMELGERTRYERHFNWKVLLENYCENYHTPFIHSQLPAGGYEYPIECAGPAVIAWDRPLAAARRVRAGTARPPPGRRRLGGRRRRGRRRVVQQRHLPRRVPQHGHLLLRRLRGDVPAHADRPGDDGRRARVLLAPDVPPSAGPPIWPPPARWSSRTCGCASALQGTYDAGLSADGVLSTEHEAGVAHIHQLAARRARRPGADRPSVRSGPWPRRPAPASPPTSGASRSSRRPTGSRSSAGCTTCASPTSPTSSTSARGLIHYHFATKDELIEAMLRETADRRGGRRAREPGEASPLPQDRLARVDRGVPPVAARDHVVGAVDRRVGRGAARRQPAADLRGARRRLGRADRRGHRRRRGQPACSAAPTRWPSSWRLCALLDGLGLQVVLHQATMTRAQMHKHVRRAAALELGLRPCPTDLSGSSGTRAQARSQRLRIGSGGRAVASRASNQAGCSPQTVGPPARVGNGGRPRQPRCTPHAVAVVVLALTASHHESKRKEVCIEMDNPRSEKVAIVDEIASKLSDSKAVFVTEYRGLKVGALATLRGALARAVPSTRCTRTPWPGSPPTRPASRA